MEYWRERDLVTTPLNNRFSLRYTSIFVHFVVSLYHAVVSQSGYYLSGKYLKHAFFYMVMQYLRFGIISCSFYIDYTVLDIDLIYMEKYKVHQHPLWHYSIQNHIIFFDYTGNNNLLVIILYFFSNNDSIALYHLNCTNYEIIPE